LYFVCVTNILQQGQISFPYLQTFFFQEFLLSLQEIEQRFSTDVERFKRIHQFFLETKVLQYLKSTKQNPGERFECSAKKISKNF